MTLGPALDPSQCNLFRNQTWGLGKPRKRRRETIEDDDSMSEGEAGKLKKEFDDHVMPEDFDLPEDTTGAMG